MSDPEKTNLCAELGELTSGEIVSQDQDFTVSHKKMGSRFLPFQKKDESYYLLRLLQGLISAGAAAVAISTTRSTIRVSVPDWQTQAPEWLDPETLLDLLGRPEQWDRSLIAVCVAILCSFDEQFEGFCWRYNGYQLGRSSADPGSLSSSRTNIRSPYFEVLFQKKKRTIFASTTKEHASCAKRLGASPVPIILDRLQLKLKRPSATVQKECWFEELSAPFFLVEAEAGKDAPLDWNELSPGFGTHLDHESWAPLKWYCDPDGPYLRMAVHLCLSGSGLLYPVIDGVIGEPMVMPDLPASLVYLSTENDAITDLSGLSVTNGQTLIDRARHFYFPLLEMVLEQLESLKAGWDMSYPNYPISKSLSSAADPISAIAILPFLAVIGGVEVASSRVRFQFEKKAHSERLRDGIRARICSLLQRRPN